MDTDKQYEWQVSEHHTYVEGASAGQATIAVSLADHVQHPRRGEVRALPVERLQHLHLWGEKVDREGTESSAGELFVYAGERLR